MKKSRKIVSVFLLTSILGMSTIPNISIAYASEQITQQIEQAETSITMPSTTSLTKEQINELSSEVHALHPDVSQEWITEVINRQLQGDYTLPYSYSPFRAAWQGVTVNEMGAAIDVAISLALGGATASLASLIQSSGKHAVKSAIRSAAAQFLGGWIVNSVLIDYAMNLLSPGTYLAEQWDARDSVPNNGRINF